MGYERYNRGGHDPDDYSQNVRDDRYSSARDYAASGYGGQRGYGPGREQDRGFDSRASGYYGRDGSQRQGGYGDQGHRQGQPYRGSYASDGHRFTEVEDHGPEHRRDHNRSGPDRGGYGRQPQGYDYDDRGFLNRAGDEVRSWFGDEDAERRREADARYDQRHDRERDADYGSWRSSQIAAFDRDYDEYRRENRSKFENEFSSWRTERQSQRDALNSVTEHMEVVGSDGSHVGTVDKLRGDRIVLTKNDEDAGGKHHSIPSRWIDTVDDKVTLRKTAEEAQHEWRDEERNQAFFGDDRNDRSRDEDRGAGLLNRSFSGTY